MKVLNSFEKIVKNICGLLLVVITVVMFMQVIARYVFNSAYAWTDEMAIYCMVWMIMLGSAVNSLRGSHIRVDFFIAWLPGKARYIVEILDQLICAGVIGYVTYYGYSLVQKNIHNLSAGLRVPISILYASIVVGGILMALLFIFKGIQYAADMAKGRDFE